MICYRPDSEFAGDGSFYHCSPDLNGVWLPTSSHPSSMMRTKDAVPSLPQYHPHPISHSRNSSASTFSRAGDFTADSSPYTGHYSSPNHLQPPYHSMQHEHLPTPTHTPTSQDFAINDPRRPHSQYSDIKPLSSGSAYAHYPRSNASNQGQDLPVTPQTVNGDDFDLAHTTPAVATADAAPNNGWTLYQAYADNGGIRNIPKLDRTISDIYSDELYNPNFGQQQQQHAQTAPTFNPAYLNPQQQQPHERITQALNAANQARSQSPNSQHSRDLSPFRHGSPFAVAPSAYPNHMTTAVQQRQQQRQHASAQAMQQYRAKREDAEPRTISPKEAFADYHDPDESSPSLFPEASSQQSNSTSNGQSNGHQNGRTQYQPPTSSSFHFATPGLPLSAQNDNKFEPPHFHDQDSNGSSYSHVAFPSHLATMETSRSDNDDEEDEEDDDDDDNNEEANEAEEEDEDDIDESQGGEVHRPVHTMADTGTYTCTYHGCQERFTSPTLLQKHKREDHRSTAPGTLVGSASPGLGGRSQQVAAMTQAGPHRCDRINPQTGKPCNSVFSRPYDLTRHEDTIHNRAKAKVQCHLCTEEKSFSRNDALTRHMKVVHPTVPWPSKHKRRR